jgi:hypothetical protein
MGKAGKARKRQRVERALNADIDVQIDSDESDNYVNSTQDDKTKHILIAISVLDALSVNLEKYSLKLFKPLRIAIFPLIKEQSDKFFEKVHLEFSTEQTNQVLSPRNLSIAIQVANQLSSNMSEFSSPELKQYRRALHPLVLYHAKNSTTTNDDKNKSKKRPAISMTSNAEEEGAGIENSCDKEDCTDINLSNHISSCFRQGQWEEALKGLQQLAADPTIAPKLGMPNHTTST